MEEDFLTITGAREHNLKNINLSIPKRKFVVFTGVSGSGKSSLAFDTIFAEGQRRYVESLSAYARQFLGQMEKPKYDSIKGLAPTISIEQKSVSNNPRSTVGTATEIYDYLRVLFARIGEQRCFKCGRNVARQSPAQIVKEIAGYPEGTRAIILSPVVIERKGEFRELFQQIRKDGFLRVRVDGIIVDLSEEISLDKNKRHSISIVVDRLSISGDSIPRLNDSVETALKFGKGRVVVNFPDKREERIFSEHLACDACGISFSELSPQLFSFNSPIGMCPDCHGIGFSLMPDPSRIVPDGNKTLREGAIEPWARSIENETGWSYEFLVSISRNYGIDLDTPFYRLPEEHKNILLFGTPRAVEVSLRGSMINGAVKVRFEGIANTILRRFRETKSEEMGRYYMRYLKSTPCESCAGTRLRSEARSVYVCGETICSLSEKSISYLYDFASSIKLSENQAIIASEILKEVGTRLKYLNHLGLNYLTLSRSIQTLSGGELQRIRLASQLGSELTGVIYILDEPSIGLHPRDNGRLISILKRLRDLGNSVIVVEHDRDAILNADYVVDFGPGAGKSGGEIVFTGTASEIKACEKSLTGGYLSGRLNIAKGVKRRKPVNFLTIKNVRQNNIGGEDVKFPLSVFTVVTGVSGAGKSSLVNEVLYPALAHHLNKARDGNNNYDSISGLEHLDKVVSIAQDPIGRTPRSNPVTYTKAFDLIRSLFSQTKEARIYGYSPGRFSFNVRGGRCEKCQGGGVIKVEMHFLPDVYITCEECGGKRFNDATLRVKFKGLSIADVLELTVDEAVGVFEHHRGILKILKTLQDVGLGYIALGQPSTTLSGGEAQRIKLARELSKTATGRTVYIMDEPSTGLHFDDIKKLLSVVNRLVDKGNTVIMIEHNLDIIKTADYIIDLGPEGGDEGGRVVACGTPEELAVNRKSHTGRCLRDVL